MNSLTSQSIGYKTKTFESRNLLFFFLVAFRRSWFWWALFIFGNLKLPPGIGTSDVDLGSAIPIILIVLFAPYGPTIAGFVIMALTERKTGVHALWKRFWIRNLSKKWLFVCLLFFPVIQLIAGWVTRTIDGQPYPLFPYPAIGVFIDALFLMGSSMGLERGVRLKGLRFASFPVQMEGSNF